MEHRREDTLEAPWRRWHACWNACLVRANERLSRDSLGSLAIEEREALASGWHEAHEFEGLAPQRLSKVRAMTTPTLS